MRIKSVARVARVVVVVVAWITAAAWVAAVLGMLLTAQSSGYAFMFMLMPRCISGPASTPAPVSAASSTRVALRCYLRVLLIGAAAFASRG